MEENILWFRLIFVKDCFWFFSRDCGKKVKLFWDRLSFVKYLRFLNKFLVIKLLIKFKLIFDVNNWWRFFIFWNIFGWIFVKLFLDKLRIFKDGKLKMFLYLIGKLVFWRYSLFKFFFVSVISKYYCIGYWLWIKL